MYTSHAAGLAQMYAPGDLWPWHASNRFLIKILSLACQGHKSPGAYICVRPAACEVYIWSEYNKSYYEAAFRGVARYFLLLDSADLGVYSEIGGG